MTFICPTHGYYAPTPGVTVAVCPQCVVPPTIPLDLAAKCKDERAEVVAERDRYRQGLERVRGELVSRCQFMRREDVEAFDDLLLAALNQEEEQGMNPMVDMAIAGGDTGLARRLISLHAEYGSQPEPVCYLGHEGCYDRHDTERLADEVDWQVERENGDLFALGWDFGLPMPAKDNQQEEWLRACRDQLPPTSPVLLDAVISQQVLQHPLPWHVESDWTEEVRAADGYCIAKCTTYEEAQAIVALASSRERES